jgi:hypothetical protein
MFPWSSPEEPYGASYGPIANLGMGLEIKPVYTPNKLKDKAVRAIELLKQAAFGPTHNRTKKPILLLGAISGVQLSDNYRLEAATPDTIITPKVKAQVESCKGFHVGSYHNKVFKRYMYTTSHPLIIFIHCEKIDCVIKVGKCHFIFDNQTMWDNFIRNYPLAFCVGCKNKLMTNAIEQFTKLGFTINEPQEFDKYTAFLASNGKFDSLFGKILTEDELAEIYNGWNPAD